jgi:hypothetical protein
MLGNKNTEPVPFQLIPCVVALTVAIGVAEQYTDKVTGEEVRKMWLMKFNGFKAIIK